MPACVGGSSGLGRLAAGGGSQKGPVTVSWGPSKVEAQYYRLPHSPRVRELGEIGKIRNNALLII